MEGMYVLYRLCIRYDFIVILGKKFQLIYLTLLLNNRPLAQNLLQQPALVLHLVVLQVQAANPVHPIQKILVVLLIVKKHPIQNE